MPFINMSAGHNRPEFYNEPCGVILVKSQELYRLLRLHIEVEELFI